MRCYILIGFFLFHALDIYGQVKDVKSFSDKMSGIYTWIANPLLINRKQYPYVKGVPLILGWKKLEPRPGVYRFEEIIGSALRHFVQQDYYTFIKVYYAPENFTPDWIFREAGVPKVQFPPRLDPFRQVKALGFPYFFDEQYKKYYYRFIEKLADYVKKLPAALQERILFIQATEGSTGDPQGYKVKPLNKIYEYRSEDWEAFRIAAWRKYIQSFSGKDGKLIKPIFVNRDSRWLEYENKWLLDNMPGPVVGIKMGTFSHGYDLSETNQRLTAYEHFRNELKKRGKFLFSRGEYDAEWRIVGWSTLNPAQAIYWSSLYALFCRLNMWNISTDAVKGKRFAPAFTLFNKYAGRYNPAIAPGAFCVLRKGLNAADTSAFPENEFGTADRKNIKRYMNIAKAFEKYGAVQNDPSKAAGGFMVNRQADKYNDVGWEITPGNYELFLHQINPEQTSAGWWHVGPSESIYGRFARGFDYATGKNKMYFRVDGDMFRASKMLYRVELRIVYLDRGTGSWSLNYSKNDKMCRGVFITCENSGKWREKKLVAEMSFNQELSMGADLLLKYEGGDNTVFHLIEITKLEDEN